MLDSVSMVLLRFSSCKYSVLFLASWLLMSVESNSVRIKLFLFYVFAMVDDERFRIVCCVVRTFRGFGQTKKTLNLVG